MKNIVLIGFMGTGKTVVGRRLATRLKRKFIDTDLAIEELTGKTIAEIFRKDGIIRFRSEEKLLSKRLANTEDLVISTGGGMVLDVENVDHLKKNGVLVCLTAEPEIIYQRVKNKRNRPLLKKGYIKETVFKLFNERKGMYDVAEYKVDTGKYSLSETLEKIISFLREKKYLC